MIVGSVVSSLISLFLLMVVGYFLRARNHIDAGVTKGLSTILVLVTQPLMIIQGLQQPYSVQQLRELGVMTGGYALVSAAGLLPCLAYCRLRRLPLRESGTWLNCAAFSNCIFMARPIAVSLWGEAVYFPLTGVMFCFNILTYSFGIFLFHLDGEGKKGGPLRQMLRFLANPAAVIGAVALLFFLFSVSLPEPVMIGIDMLAGLGTPLAMIIIGAQLAESGFKRIIADRNVYILSALRLIAGPLAAWVLLKPLIQAPLLFGILILTSAMPTATSMAVFAERFDNNAQFVSGAVFVSTILSLATIPVMMALLL